MGLRPSDTFLPHRAGEGDLRRPAPRRRPDADPVTGPSASVPGNPLPPAPKQR